MPEEADTQALAWLRAMQQQIENIQKNMDYCIRGQVAGKLTQDDFDDFVEKVTEFARLVIASTEGV